MTRSNPKPGRRRRLARPLLIAVGALSLGALVAACDDDTTGTVISNDFGNHFGLDLSVKPDLSTKD